MRQQIDYKHIWPYGSFRIFYTYAKDLFVQHNDYVEHARVY